MTTYSFKITKGKYQLSLTTTDRDMIVDQFEKWVRKASSYVKNTKKQEYTGNTKTDISAERYAQKRVEEELKSFKKPVEPNNEYSEKTDTTKNDLDTIFESKQNENVINETVEKETAKPQNLFDNLLNRSMNSEQNNSEFKPNPSIKKDSAFLNFISGRKIERKIDYLLMTAYYFTQYEQKPRFTLKQLNAKLMQNLAVILDHSVIQEAVNRDYIECLPDLTGIVGTSEYRLTAYGEKTLLEEG